MSTIASLLHNNSLPIPNGYAAAATPAASASANSSSSSGGSDAGALSASDSLANEQTFLQLLVAQLQNQDPDNPMDGTQFVTQLAQFSSLEQELAMRQDLDTIASAFTTTPTSGGSGTGSGSDGNAVSNKQAVNRVE